MVLLSGCRLLLSVEGSGVIYSDSGTSDCTQASCVIPVTGLYAETFTAVAADGHRFVGWTGLCERSPTEVCSLVLLPMPEEYGELDGDVEVSALFESAAVRRAWYRDSDGDFYGAANESKLAYEQPRGFVINNSDCDDANYSVNPGSLEQNDDIDNDCDGLTDEGFKPTVFFIDRDGDGFGDALKSRLGILKPAGYVSNDLDCNDRDAGDNPQAEEVMDNRDNDCDGSVDETAASYYPDVDGDGFGAASGSIESSVPVPGYVQDSGDCDDNNSSIFPGAREDFDSVDNDCDGAIDEGFTLTRYYRDIDGDGYGDASDSVMEAIRPAGYVANGSDNCVEIKNTTQADTDNDGIGDACDPFTDKDGDGVQDSADNCPSHSNPSQSDSDGDGLGDACDTVNNNSGGCSLSAEDQSMLDTVNATRAQARTCGSYGAFPVAAPLAWRCELQAAALAHSADMANNDFFSHTSLNGDTVGDRVTRAGYAWSSVGENIAAGVSLSSVAAVVQAWLGSPGHCANMMSSGFTQLGAAKYGNAASTYNVYWTQVFGKPR